MDSVHVRHYILCLMSIVEQLEAAGEVLTPAVREALMRLEAVAALVPVLEERIRELEVRLKLNSTNSSLPPSSDSSSVKRPAKKPTGKKRGGQKGHRGHHRQLIAAERVDKGAPACAVWPVWA